MQDYEINDVPENKVHETIQKCKLDSPASIETIKQPNGLFTIKVKF